MSEDSGYRRRGRPAKQEGREPMDKVVTFRVDEATDVALQRLIEAMRGEMPIGVAPGSIQAAAIRRAIQIAAGMLDVDPDLPRKR